MIAHTEWGVFGGHSGSYEGGRHPDGRCPTRTHRAMELHPSDEDLSPGTPGLERETRIELATNSLEGCDSTTELLPQKQWIVNSG